MAISLLALFGAGGSHSSTKWRESRGLIDVWPQIKKEKIQSISFCYAQDDATYRELPMESSYHTTHVNTSRDGFGMPSYVGRFGQNGGAAHESINCMGAVIGATLAGIDKSSQDGRNWVLMQENYFSSSNGQNIYLNNIGGVSGTSFWYDVLPSVLFYQLNYLYPNTGNFNSEFTITADRWYDALVAMGAKTSPWTLPNLDHTAFAFATMTPYDNGVWKENDSAAAIGWVEYMAYIKTGNAKYLTGARWCMEYLQSQGTSPLYDVLLVFAPYVATRMNAEQGTGYDVSKLMNWCFGGNANGWGVLATNWGGIGVDGLMSSQIYAFEMESLSCAGATVPVARYDQRYARAIGKYMLNAANSMRLFYSNAFDAAHQTCYTWASTYDPCACIGYEGLKKTLVSYAKPAADYSTYPGTIASGNYSRTWAKDSMYEVLQETYLSNNNDQLVHIWSIPLSGVYWDKLVVNGHYEKSGTDPDTGFAFYWSMSPTGPWTGPIFMVNMATDKDYWIDGNWPTSGGTLYLKAADNDLSIRGFNDKLYVDQIWVECKDDSIAPYASGDAISFGWGNTDLGLYGSSYVGVLGGIVSTTNVEKILKLDLLKTDYYRDAAYPTYLYYNPYTSAKTVDVNVGSAPADVYETVSQEMVAVNIAGTAAVQVPANSAMVLVVAPAGGKVTISGGKKYINGVIVDYRSNTIFSTCGQAVASPQRLVGDLNGDCTVDMDDIRVLADEWLGAGPGLGAADITGDSQVSLNDFAQLAGNWMASLWPDVQLESFDNFAAAGWSDAYNTGLAIQTTNPAYVHEGTGALRVNFEARTNQWDVVPTRYFSPALNLSGKTLSLWLWTDLVNDSVLKQVIIFDTAGHVGRFSVPRPGTTGWTKITAPVSSFVPDGAAVDTSNIGTMQLWLSTWDTPGNSVYVDDLRVY